jgi:RHS repeat-associated protein
MPVAPTTVQYRRDLLGRLVAAGTATDPNAFGSWSWRGDGALAQETLKAGGTAEVMRSFAHDGLARPVSIDEPAMTQTISFRRDGDAAKPYAGGGIAAEAVTYKAAGFPAGAAPPSSTTSYTYDAFGRLTKAGSSERPALEVDASYDGNGNLGSLVQAGESRSYEYVDGTNKLDAVMVPGKKQTYAHDPSGAVTSAAGTTLVRDPATGRMRRGKKGEQSLSVLRDGRGRIALTVQGSAKRFSLRDNAGAVLWAKEGAAAATVHVHGATGRIGLWNGTANFAVSKDLRGSTSILYGGDGKAAAWLSYCAYGALDAGASSTNALTSAIRQRYTGQDWLEPLGLYDHGARLYDPALGRFLSPDPKDETPSPYMYVAGDPVNGVDPDGAMKIYLLRAGNRTFLLGKTTRNCDVLARSSDPDPRGIAHDFANDLEEEYVRSGRIFITRFASDYQLFDPDVILRQLDELEVIPTDRLDMGDVQGLAFLNRGHDIGERVYSRGTAINLWSFSDVDIQTRKIFPPTGWVYRRLDKIDQWVYDPDWPTGIPYPPSVPPPPPAPPVARPSRSFRVAPRPRPTASLLVRDDSIERWWDFYKAGRIGFVWREKKLWLEILPPSNSPPGL